MERSNRPAIGVVSYLNARPLVEGLESDPRVRLVRDVPSRLIARLLSGEVDVALCPAIDYQTSPEELAILPAGAIGSDGETLTVRVFSRVPLDALREVEVDGDSHTSVALLRILFARSFGRTLRTLPAEMPRRPPAWDPDGPLPEAVLMIGDKVVAAAPPAGLYPYQVDLGQAWKELTGLPFVFALWMARPGADLGELPELLAATLRRNLARIPEIAGHHAAGAGWPVDLARRYLGEILTYTAGPRELEAARLFWRLAHEEGLAPRHRPLSLLRV
ncbi:MAG: menaquinone biosynthesis protein [Acidobacteria bacterium]|nr:menaquinone biosynthesis protein [Acidobacteriota bacterium]